MTRTVDQAWDGHEEEGFVDRAGYVYPLAWGIHLDAYDGEFVWFLMSQGKTTVLAEGRVNTLEQARAAIEPAALKLGPATFGRQQIALISQ